VVAVTGLGGDFGLSGRSPAIEGGALAGLLKAIRHEFPSITAKVIDAPLDDPPQLVARCALHELASGAADIEVAYVCGRRRVLQPVPRTVPTAEQSVGGEWIAGSGVASAEDDALRPHGTWIVTGGGRGVTAVVARELAQRYALKLHLIGSSPSPAIPDEWRTLSVDARREQRGHITQQARAAGRDPGAAWRDVERGLELDASLRAFVDAGVAVTYHPCDIADNCRLAAVLQSIRASDGPIHGILHGAGFEEACRFDKKTPAGVHATLAAKVDGAVNLALLTHDDPVEYFIGFGSISGRFGGRGQTDYSMSSDLLAKLLCRLRHERPGCRAAAIHWPVWGGVGMAMRPESKLALEIAGQQFMPLEEGVAHLVDELVAGAPEAEVLLYDWPATRNARRSPWTPAEAQSYWKRARAIAAAPLIEGLAHLAEDRLSAELKLEPARDPFLVQHHYEGTPILPLVIALEALAESACLLDPALAVGALQDVRIHDGMRFYSPDAEDCRVDVHRSADGTIRSELRADFRNRRGTVADPSRLYVSAAIEHVQHVVEPTVDWCEPPVTEAMPYDSEEAKLVQRMIWHGPVFRCLREFCVVNDTLWGRIVATRSTELRPGTTEAGWRLPAAVLDACLQACSTLTYVNGGEYHLPQAIGRLRFVRRGTASRASSSRFFGREAANRRCSTLHCTAAIDG
jgi:NAD(P)-dependent dehydrogenase (short-subunit alcohol dehydrogenase family)